MKVHRAPLVAALLLSVLAHAVTLGTTWLTLPRQEPAPVTLTARLNPMKPMQPAPSAPAAAQPRTAVKPTRVAAAAVNTRPSFVAAPIIAEPHLEPVTETAPQAESNPAATEKPPEQEPVMVATAAPTTLATPAMEIASPLPPQAIRALPRKGRITYNLNYFVSGAPLQIGRTVQSWELTGTQYQLDSRSETSGLARLTRFGPRVFSSKGEVTPHGLQPSEFTSSVTVSGNIDNSAARFDWSAKQLQFGRSIDPKNAALPQGTQDFVSFMYQLSLAPLTGNRIQIPVTNGVRFDTLDFEVRPEEQLETPLGVLRVIPVVQARKPNTESMEVWLAAEYNYLPVRLRFLDRDGKPGGEQIVTDIRVGNE